MRKRLAAVPALALPFLAVAIAPRLAVGPVATAVARHLSDASARLSPDPRVEHELEPVSFSEFSEAAIAPALGLSSVVPARSRGARRPPRRPSAKSTTRAIFVPRTVVERAIRAHRHPTGSAVDPSASHPAGVGVSGGAAPLQAGDVITDVDGRPVRSVEEIVVAVASALRAKPKTVSGRFWRGGEPWTLTVEIPW